MPCPAGGRPIRSRSSGPMPTMTNRSSRRPSGGEHAHRAVAGVHVPHRGLHDVVQRRLELAAGGGRAQRGGEHRRDVHVGGRGAGRAVGRGHGPTVGGLAGTGSGPGTSGRRSARRGRSGTTGEATAGRGPGHGLAEQGLAAGADERRGRRRWVAAVSASKTGRSRTAVRVRPCTPVSAIARSTWASSRSWAARCARTSDARRALERIAVRGVEDADGDDGRLAAGGLAQRPHQGAVAGGRAVDLDDAARGSAGAAAAGAVAAARRPGRGLSARTSTEPADCGSAPGPSPAPGQVGCRS